MNVHGGSGASAAMNDPAQAASLVLIIDDEAGVRESLRFLLEPEFRVEVAPSGEAGLHVLVRETVDVILLDLTMPGMGGVETLARIREVDESVEVVIITGYGSYQSAVDALRLRAFDYITKPLDSTRVLTTVRRAEESRQQRSEAAPGDRFEINTRQILELLDALAVERPAGFTDRFFVKLDYARLLAQTLRDRIGGSTAALAVQVSQEVVELERLLPEKGADPARHVLGRIVELARTLPPQP
ncbi:MAG TPA: response regulator [Candidatus Binatia bacterium]|nr:response regulator [Candidatus Binatia bacterium]